MKKRYKTCRLVLGDQLNIGHSWYNLVDDSVLYVMFELEQELTYTTHHIQKACAFLQSMRQFSKALQTAGHQVYYLTLDETSHFENLTAALEHCKDKFKIESFEYQMPDEYRLDQQLTKYSQSLLLNHKVVDTEHFLTTRDELENYFLGKKSLLMENFYRYIRRKWHILIQEDKPVGDRWNFDSENRKALPKDHTAIEHLLFNEDVSSIVDMLKRHDINTIGSIDKDNFIWPTSRKKSRELLEYFVTKLLPEFGNYQDAMIDDDPFIYHSRLSFCLNSKMLHPLEVVNRAVEHWQANQDHITLSQIEGFVRQIIGWREYMRGVYWAKMPAYANLNYFEHKHCLPDYYWTADTKMHCMKAAISQSLKYAYAHHIQRLMVTGNFALLAGIHPDEVDKWYLGIYIDALQWVEITNTRGMSQFADGGIVATKPYVSSGNYINKMSHYCKNCHYRVKEKTGETACPFNSLYWHFIDRNSHLLAKNPRMGMVYRTWNKMSEQHRRDILETASNNLRNISAL